MHTWFAECSACSCSSSSSARPDRQEERDIRLTRNQVLEVLSDDYVRTARAKGLPERRVVVKHALRAGLTPIVTAAGLDLAGLLGGAIIIFANLVVDLLYAVIDPRVRIS